MATDRNFADDPVLAIPGLAPGPQAQQAQVVGSRANTSPGKDGRVVTMDETEEPQCPRVLP
jgi:hypothetical protein